MTINDALAVFAKAAHKKLESALGEPEDQVRAPLEAFFSTVGELADLNVTLVGETHLAADRIRPDFAALVGTNPVPVGFIELKAPGVGADAARFRGRNKIQFERLCALPNVLYTDGNSWTLYRTGEAVRRSTLSGDLRDGSLLDTGDLEALLDDFLLWEPAAPRTTGQLVSAIAGLCRLLRDEVTELALESETLERLASDWRDLLFPDATADEFADGYAQAVTFALLLARAEGIGFEDRSVDEIAVLLGKEHSLLGKALSVLTDETLVAAMSTSVNTLVRVCAVVDWDRLSHHGRAPWLRFYEDFLAEYDPELRKRTGSYYTPNGVVASMTRITDELLRDRLGLNSGFLASEVTVVDPATGTGTFLLHTIEQVAATVEEEEGPGAVGPRLKELASRLVGFERQIGPFAVAELRAFEEFRDRSVELPADGLRLYVTDTLDNPYIEETRLGAGYDPIARSRRAANKVKADEPVMVIIGNPPYRDRAGGLGGWVEHGDPAAGSAALLDDFVPPKDWGVGAHTKHLKNQYVYFWRWALWKAFEAHDAAPFGVVAFITPGGFTTGPGFSGMRAYMRSLADEIWVIDCTPEGHRPDVSTRLFPGVQQPLAITFVLRNGSTDRETPAAVHYRAVTGRRVQKFAQLDKVHLAGVGWTDCATEWGARFAPAGTAQWAEFVAVGDLFPWSSPGVKPNRTWPIATKPQTLAERWDRLVAAAPDKKAVLFKESRDSNLARVRPPLPGYADTPAFSAELGACPEPVRYPFRAFDTEWILPDSRLLNDQRMDLWASMSQRQVFIIEQHAEPLEAGPALLFTAAVPDQHYFNGRGGRALPLWRDAEGTEANIAPGLLGHLETAGLPSAPEELVAYIAAVAAHPGFTSRFATELTTPGVRVPLTADRTLFDEAVELGSRIINLHTFGARAGVGPAKPRLEPGVRPKVGVAIPDSPDEMPESIGYDPETLTLSVGDGRIAPVSPAAWAFEVSTHRVVQRWLKRRLREPEGKRSSPLDDMVPSHWSADTTAELLDLLNVVELLIAEEAIQDDLLTRILEHGEFISTSALTGAGVLPPASASRRPNRRIANPVLFD